MLRTVSRNELRYQLLAHCDQMDCENEFASTERSLLRDCESEMKKAGWNVSDWKNVKCPNHRPQ